MGGDWSMVRPRAFSHAEHQRRCQSEWPCSLRRRRQARGPPRFSRDGRGDPPREKRDGTPRGVGSQPVPPIVGRSSPRAGEGRQGGQQRQRWPDCPGTLRRSPPPLSSRNGAPPHPRGRRGESSKDVEPQRVPPRTDLQLGWGRILDLRPPVCKKIKKRCCYHRA